MFPTERPAPQPSTTPSPCTAIAGAPPPEPRAEAPPDFQALFEATPTPLLVLRPPDWRIVAVNDAYLQATMTRRDELLGRRLFDAFPDDPADAGGPHRAGVRHLGA